MSDTRQGFAIWFSREQWGAIQDGLILELARTKERVAVNPASTGQSRAETCVETMQTISKYCKQIGERSE